ncbi:MULTISPECIES: ribonuclease HII [Vitreoscilla]|uniref:Ribonuclease HII n=1 Tax=Vitreoscilla stercoraria TaxID=61 RepID=A0ABY4EC17_VITST|nr:MULTISPECIES: ribonuclease HII [Vitreoscilla]AUZ03943.2 ribonuclease HII [Vitreoscilla sp. C1]UOO92133.1 ribonuclease HII [Vitreoscilla stercoraria]
MVSIWITGVDEAGRGPLVGSVFAAAVILPENYDLPYLTDSKKLTEARRDVLAPLIQEQAVAWCVASANVAEIESLNILHATMLAMTRAVQGLQVVPQEVLIDGNRVPKDMPYAARAIVKGDLSEPVISAASVLAKTARDAQMYALDVLHPQYGFARHKGYGTPEHLAALNQYGVLKEHRVGFKPIKDMVQRDLFGSR